MTSECVASFGLDRDFFEFFKYSDEVGTLREVVRLSFRSSSKFTRRLLVERVYAGDDDDDGAFGLKL